MTAATPHMTGLVETGGTGRSVVSIPERGNLILGAAAAAGGVVLQVVLEQLHPHHAQPNDSAAAFTEYAHSHGWEAVHIGQFAGVVLIAAGMLVLAGSLARQAGTAGALARGAAMALVALTAVFAVQMAVDGVALKHAVDTWMGSTGSARTSALQVAEATRWLEKGLDAFFLLLNGVALLALGASTVVGRTQRAWPGWIAIVAGAGFVTGGASTALSRGGRSVPRCRAGSCAVTRRRRR